MAETKTEAKVVQLQLTEGEITVLMAGFGQGSMIMLEVINELSPSLAGDIARVQYFHEFIAGMQLTTAGAVQQMISRMRILQREGFK